MASFTPFRMINLILASKSSYISISLGPVSFLISFSANYQSPLSCKTNLILSFQGIYLDNPSNISSYQRPVCNFNIVVNPSLTMWPTPSHDVIHCAQLWFTYFPSSSNTLWYHVEFPRPWVRVRVLKSMMLPNQESQP